MASTWDDADESDADETGYDTESDSHFDVSDAESHTPTFSNNRRLSADPSVVTTAKYPQHPAPEPADAAPHPAPAPSDVECPTDIHDLFANNRAGAKTWDEVLGGLEALSQYLKARGKY